MINHWWATPHSMTSRSLHPADSRKCQHHKVKLEIVESGLASKLIPMVSRLSLASTVRGGGSLLWYYDLLDFELVYTLQYLKLTYESKLTYFFYQMNGYVNN